MVYTVHDQSEETVCDWCGRPLYAGDQVYTDESYREVFCSSQDQRAYNREVRGHWSNAEYSEPMRSIPGFLLDEIL